MKFNHRANIEAWQPARLKALYPGMIVQFEYPKSSKTSDPNPMILLLYKEYEDNYLIHGLNLNYIKEARVQKLFCTCELLFKGASIYSKEPIRRTIQSQMDDYDDTLPGRNLLREPFTRIMLPTFKERRDGNPQSKSEAKRQMKMLYDKVIKKILRKSDIYRTYLPDKMESIKVLRYTLGEWSQPGMDDRDDDIGDVVELDV